MRDRHLDRAPAGTAREKEVEERYVLSMGTPFKASIHKFMPAMNCLQHFAAIFLENNNLPPTHSNEIGTYLPLPLHLKTEKHYIHFKKSLKEHFMD